MNINERNGNQSVPVETTEPIGEQHETLPHPRLSLSPEPEATAVQPETPEPEKYATRSVRWLYRSAAHRDRRGHGSGRS
jgi:hypothetical protein